MFLSMVHCCAVRCGPVLGVMHAGSGWEEIKPAWVSRFRRLCSQPSISIWIAHARRVYIRLKLHGYVLGQSHVCVCDFRARNVYYVL